MTETTPRYGPPVTPEKRADARAAVAAAVVSLDRANELLPGVTAIRDAIKAVERAYEDDEFQPEGETMGDYALRYEYMGECFWCGRPLYDASEDSGRIEPDPATNDGDFCCDSHPLSLPDVGSFRHKTVDDVKKIMLRVEREKLERDDPRCSQCGALPEDGATENFTEHGEPCPECVARGRAEDSPPHVEATS